MARVVRMSARRDAGIRGGTDPCFGKPRSAGLRSTGLDSVPATVQGGGMELLNVRIEKPDDLNLILGQSHFVKTVEDLHEALAGSSPHLRFGIAFCESSGPRLVRRSVNDPELVELATRNALAIGAGHSFIVFLREGYPVNVLNQVKQVPEVCRVYCATANPVDVVVGETSQGRGVLGVIDGGPPLGVEGAEDVAA